VLRRLRIENLVLIREAELVFGPGLNVVTGETGAGKTILAQAIGLLLGAKGAAAYLGPVGDEAYVEAELDLPDGILDEADAIAELRPQDEPGLVTARRVFADGRSRAYAWGRAAAREDVAALVERLIAMSGQFEQRRLGRPAHQLETLDAYVGEDQVAHRRGAAHAWRDVQAARRARDELAASAAGAAAYVAELEALVEAAGDLEPGIEDALRHERERLRNAAELVAATSAAAEALSPEIGEGEGAADLAARAAGSLDPVAGIAPELASAAAHLVDGAARLRDTASELRAFLASLEAEPGRLEEVEERLGDLADAKRRFGAISTEDLVERAAEARAELARLSEGRDPVAAAEEAVAAAEARYDAVAGELSDARRAAAVPFADAARAELARLGLGDGDLEVRLGERDPGSTGRDEVVFLVRPNPGLPFAPVATTASGGELSRIALALRAVAHAQAGEPTIVFDEIDAGIGGQTAHAVAESLRRLATVSQVVAITHLPQIASVADRHLRVEKVPGDPTHTRIEVLGEAERTEELERMLGGAEFLEAIR
jgi:DNA repair protein RecN (Recombination protein N)